MAGPPKGPGNAEQIQPWKSLSRAGSGSCVFATRGGYEPAGASVGAEGAAAQGRVLLGPAWDEHHPPAALVCVLPPWCAFISLHRLCGSFIPFSLGRMG